MKSYELIKALEEGYVLEKDYAIAFPDQHQFTEKRELVTTLWMEGRNIYMNGWASALGTVSHRLIEIIEYPERYAIGPKLLEP